MTGRPPRRAGAGDVAAVARRLGRAPEAGFEVVVRDAAGEPVVIRNEPFLDDGRPMPTRYWLVDPELVRAVARIESGGGVRQAEREVDPADLARAHARYAAERDRAAAGAQETLPGGPVRRAPGGGVGGTRRGVKCLHAHLAWWLAGGEDPVGAWTAQHLGLSRGG